MQKYNADANDVYLGVGKITLEDPTGTDIFYGRIKRVTGNSAEKTVVLECYDWLDQLDEKQITYDMREKLNGNTRQSVIMSDYENTDANGISPASNIGGTFYVYDHDIGLTANAHNGMKMILTAGMAGTKSWSSWPYQETVTPSAAPMNVDLFVGAGADDISYLWSHDGEYHSLSDGADFFVVYDFKAWVPDSDFYVASSITGARVKMKYRAGTSFVVTLQVNSGGYVVLDELDQNTAATDGWGTFEIPTSLLAGMFDANGVANIKVDVAAGTGGTIRIYYIELEIDTTTTGHDTAISITDGETYRLTVGTDLSADATKVWDGLPYCVAQEIYKHIDQGEEDRLIQGDSIVALTAAAKHKHQTVQRTYTVADTPRPSTRGHGIILDNSRRNYSNMEKDVRGRHTATYGRQGRVMAVTL
jgi:hypothetical protein